VIIDEQNVLQTVYKMTPTALQYTKTTDKEIDLLSSFKHGYTLYRQTPYSECTGIRTIL
jgi:hypothetical protein